MNRRAKLPRPAGARWAGIRLVLSLFPGVAISGSSSVAPEIPPSPSRPYLSAVGAPALRFGEAPPPPDLRPAAGAPPVPKEETLPAEAPAPAAMPPTSPIASQPAEPTASSAAEIAPTAKPTPARAPAPILPDDTRSKVRAEDFLPFFQFPVTNPNGDVTVVAPVPAAANSAAPLPPSSATYRQQ